MALSTLAEIEVVVRTLAITHFRLGTSLEVFFNEALAAADWAKGDKERLLQKRLDWDLVEEMPLRVALARKADAQWNAARYAHNAAANTAWDEKFPAAQELREELFADMDLAYEDDPAMCQRISEVREGTGKPDFVQDFFDMVALCRAKPQPMIDIGFDIARLDEVEALATELGRLLSAAGNEKLATSGELLFRDQCATHVNNALRKIRSYGTCVSRNNPERLVGYQSASGKRKAQAQRAAAKAAREKASAAAPATGTGTDSYGE